MSIQCAFFTAIANWHRRIRWRLLTRKGNKHYQANRLCKARKLYREALLAARVIRIDHWLVGRALTNLAATQRALGEGQGQKESLLAALDEFRLARWQDPRLVVATWINLGTNSRETGAFEDAEHCIRQALFVCDRFLLSDPAMKGQALSNLALLRKSQTRLAESLQLYQQALQVFEHYSTESDIRLLDCLCDIAIGLEESGRFADAEAMATRALNERSQYFGNYDPKRSAILHLLGRSAEAQQKFEDAAAHFRSAIALDRRTLGPAHVDVAHGLNNLGHVCLIAGDLFDARHLLLQAMEIYERNSSLESEAGAACHRNLGSTLSRLGQDSEALAHWIEARRVYEQMGVPDCEDVADCLVEMAKILKRQGRYLEAEETVKTAIDIRRQTFRGHHPYLAVAINELAGIVREQGDRRAAFELYDEARRIYLDTLGENREDLAVTLANMAILCKYESEYDRADEYWSQAIEIVLQKQSRAESQSMSLVREYLSFLEELGRHEEAESLRERAQGLVLPTSVSGDED